LPYRLQSRLHSGEGGTAGQSAYARIGSGAARKEETSRMKNVSIESSGRKKVFGMRKILKSQKNSFNNNNNVNLYLCFTN
jgi:hypothetical protein